MTRRKLVFTLADAPVPAKSGCRRCGNKLPDDVPGRVYCSPRCRRAWKLSQPGPRFYALVPKPVPLEVWAARIERSEREGRELALDLASRGRLAVLELENRTEVGIPR